MRKADGHPIDAQGAGAPAAHRWRRLPRRRRSHRKTSASFGGSS